MHVFRERASAINSNKILLQGRPQVVRDVILSSKPKYCERKYGLHMLKKNGYSFVNAPCLQKILRGICQHVAVPCRTAETTEIREMESFCIRQRAIMNWPSGNCLFALSSNFNPNGLFKISSVHFSSDCFEWTVHKKGAPR